MGNWRFGAFPKLPYSTMQQLNLDWILDRIRRFLPDTGTKGQVLTRTKDGAAWVDPEAASGAVSSVNGKTGAVVLTASDVGALPSSYQAPVTSVNGMTGDVVISGGGAVDSVNGKTGAVVLTASDVGALPESYVPPAAPVQSVNGQTGAVQLSIPDSTSDLINDSGFITAAQAPVTSVNGKTGNVVLTAADVGAAEANTSGTGYCKMPDGTLMCWGVLSGLSPRNLTGTPAGSLYYHTYTANVTFPISFVDLPSISVTRLTGRVCAISWVVTDTTTFSSFDTLSGQQTIESTRKLAVSWQAIGRWKE